MSFKFWLAIALVVASFFIFPTPDQALAFMGLMTGIYHIEKYFRERRKW